MARGRASLTDKEEKILIQAQLMGLSTASMVKIGNRLRAIEKEREEIAQIQEAIEGFTWAKITDNSEKKNLLGWTVTTPDGLLCEFTNRQRSNKSSWYERVYHYDVKISKPGTRFKERRLKKIDARVSDDWRARLCPGGNKELYALVRWARNIKSHMEAVK